MSVSTYSWPLNDSPFSFWDRAKLCAFILNPRNRWTQGAQVKAFEEEMARYIGCEHAVFVSSGSTANTLLAMYLKDNSYTPERDTVVFPSTTWTTSVAPFVREGFKPHFLDITIQDLSMNLDLLETYLLEHGDRVAAVFVTSLLGMCPDVVKLWKLKNRYPKVRFWMDNCESTLSTYNSCNISDVLTSTTSTYYGHLINSVEGGFVFTNSRAERDYFLMARNHGMTRSVADPELYRNQDVDPRFDFHLLGNNFRNTDIAAYLGRMDLARADRYVERRRFLYNLFASITDKNNLMRFSDRPRALNAMFAIPLIPSVHTADAVSQQVVKDLIVDYCRDNKIETRPIISGNLLAHRAYKEYGRREDHPVSEYVHSYGLYVGLYAGLHEDKVRALAGFVNELDSGLSA